MDLFVSAILSSAVTVPRLNQWNITATQIINSMIASFSKVGAAALSIPQDDLRASA